MTLKKTNKKTTPSDLSPPTREQLETELRRERHKRSYRQALRGTVYVLAVVAAVAVLISTLLFPVLRIHGNSMTPTVEAGNVIVTLKNAAFQRGDISAFYYNNSILVKRIIALPGEWVNIDEEGNVYVNDAFQEEPYLVEGARAFGECDITLPYQVPDERVFVMGDHRSVSVDSRSTSVGCVAEEQIVGKLIFRLWPRERFGPVK